MSGERVAFDSAATFVVACPDLPCGPRRFARGDVLPWRDVGLTEHDLLRLWLAQQVDVAGALSDAELERLTAPTHADGGSYVAPPSDTAIAQTFTMAPGETVTFDPPKSKSKRR